MAFAINSVVQGYHIYKDIWSAEIDSELPCCAEFDNEGTDWDVYKGPCGSAGKFNWFKIAVET